MSRIISDALGVEGLIWAPDWITQADADALIATIDASPWSAQIASRRVQQYGWRYDYHRGQVDHSMRLGPLPAWASALGERVVEAGWMETPEQVIVNEYLPGQGIANHIDHALHFGPVVASLSLCSGVWMRFRYNDQEREIWLEPRGLLVLTGPARRDWSHGIAKRKGDVRDGVRVPRRRRVSITLRTMRLDEQRM